MTGLPMTDATRAEICVVACAEAFRGDRNLLDSPMGAVRISGGRLARETVAPEMVCTDTVSSLVAGNDPVGAADSGSAAAAG